MAEKLWYKTQISLECNQDVSIYPDDGYNGIVVEAVVLDNNTRCRIYLNKQEMEFVIAKMREMMDFTENN